jgi:hypothetical protein
LQPSLFSFIFLIKKNWNQIKTEQKPKLNQPVLVRLFYIKNKKLYYFLGFFFNFQWVGFGFGSVFFGSVWFFGFTTYEAEIKLVDFLNILIGFFSQLDFFNYIFFLVFFFN